MSQPQECPAGDRVLDQLLADYLRAVDAGSAPDRTALLARHPELRGELEKFFAAQDNVDRWTAPLRELCAAPSTVNEARTLAGDEPRGAAPPTDRCGDYELLAEIARGGMGVVYRARHKRLDRVVALKMILAGNLASAVEVQRFRSEAQAAARLDHPHIVPIYEVGEHEGRHFFTMKLIEGGNLAHAVGSAPWKVDSRAGQQHAAALMAKVARAVHYAHQHGILHRDLKPANILLASAASGDLHPTLAECTPHITDFGLAKRVGALEENATLAPALTQTGAIVGTPSYMAPEQTGGDQALTTAVDTYSLGAILFEMLTGRPPFRGDSPIDTVFQVRELEAPRPRSFNPALDYELETVCLKCLEKDPAKRYDSAQALAEDLERWLADEPIVGRRAGTWERTRKWVRRHPAVSALLGTSSVAAACLLIAAGFLWHNAELRAEAVQNLGKANEDLKVAQDEREAAAREAQRLEQAAAAEQTKLEKLQKLADLERAAALAARREAAHVLYAADMQFAHAAWQAADIPRFRQLLNNHRPAADAPDLRGFEWHYLARFGGQARLTIKTAAEVVVALAPDGKRLASAGADRKIRIWDADSGKLLQTLPGPAKSIAIAFTPEGNKLRLVAGSELKPTFDAKDVAKMGVSPLASISAVLTTQVVDLSNLDEAKTEKLDAADLPAPATLLVSGLGGSYKTMVTLPGGAIFSPMAFALAPDRKTLAAAGFVSTTKFKKSQATIRQGGAVLLWDVEKNQRKAMYEGHESALSTAVYSPQGVLATAGFDCSIILWGDDGKPRTTLAGHRAPPMALAFTADGKQLFSGATDGAVNVWDIAQAKLTHTLHGQQKGIISLAVTADGRRLVASSSEGDIKVWDLQTAFGPAPTEFDGGVSTLAFARDGHTLLALEQNGMLNVTDVGTGKIVAKRRVMPDKVTGFGAFAFGLFSPCVAVAADGALIAHADSARAKTRIVVRDGAEGKELHAFPGLAHVLAFSPDGTMLAAATGNLHDPGEVALWHLPSGQELLSFKEPHLAALAFSPDGKRLAVGSRDSKLLIWDIPGRRQLVRLERPRQVRAVAFSADGRLVAAGGGDGVSIHDAATGKETLTFSTYSHHVFGVTFSPDGKRLATAGGPGANLSGGGLKLWDTATGRETITLGNPFAFIGAVAFSPDGSRLAAVVSMEQGILNNFGGTRGKCVIQVWETR